MAAFARLAGSPDKLAALVGETTLTADPVDPYYEGVLFALRDGGMTAPARSDSPSVYTSYDPGFFESYAVERAGYVVLGTGPTLRWLDWLDDDRVEVVFGGDADQLIRWAEIRGTDHRVRADPLPTDVAVGELDLGMPAAFATDGRFAPDSEPAPATVETDAATLSRLVTAADIVDGDGVPVVAEDGQFRLAVSGRVMDGVGTLSGPVRLEIVPGGSIAVIQEGAAATRRYVFDERV